MVLRYFNPSGAHSSGKIGESRGTPPKNLMPCICHAALGKLKKFTIFGSDYDTPDGTGRKDIDCELFFVCLFDLILYVPSTIFQLYRDRSSWV